MVEKPINRRQVLQASSASVGSILLSSNVIGASSVKTERIPTAKSGDEVLETRKVPVKWVNRYRSTKKACKALAKRLESSNGEKKSKRGLSLPEDIETVGIAKQDRDFGGVPGLQLKIGVRKDGPSKTDIPSHSEGIPIKVEEKPETEPHSCDESCGAEQPMNPVEGGARLGGAAGGVTSAGLVEYRGDDLRFYGDEYLLTCAHGFKSPNDKCNGIDIGEDVYQPDSLGNYVGFPHKYNIHDDWALIKKDGNVRFSTAMIDTDYYIGGHVSETEAAFMASNDHPCYKMGRETCLQQGTVKEIQIFDGWGRDDCPAVDWVESELPSLSGDSGAPVFKKSSGDKAYLLNINAGGGNCDILTARGVSGYKMWDRGGIYFGGPS